MEMQGIFYHRVRKNE